MNSGDILNFIRNTNQRNDLNKFAINFMNPINQLYLFKSDNRLIRKIEIN